MSEIDQLKLRVGEREAMLRRIDDVMIWEITPLGRGIQEEIEALLRGGAWPGTCLLDKGCAK